MDLYDTIKQQALAKLNTMIRPGEKLRRSILKNRIGVALCDVTAHVETRKTELAKVHREIFRQMIGEHASP